MYHIGRVLIDYIKALLALDWFIHFNLCTCLLADRCIKRKRHVMPQTGDNIRIKMEHDPLGRVSVMLYKWQIMWLRHCFYAHQSSSRNGLHFFLKGSYKTSNGCKGKVKGFRDAFVYKLIHSQYVKITLRASCLLTMKLSSSDWCRTSVMKRL